MQQQQQAALDGLHVAIIVTDYFEQVELTEPRRALHEAGARTSLVSDKDGSVRGLRHIDKADEFPVDLALADARPEDFGATLLPGGVFNADKLRVNPHAQRFVRAMEAAGKPLAVICHGPWLLVSAGLMPGREITSYHTLQDDIRNAGGRWRDLPFVRDLNWVSSRKPDDLPDFCAQMTALFAEYQMLARERAARRAA